MLLVRAERRLGLVGQAELGPSPCDPSPVRCLAASGPLKVFLFFLFNPDSPLYLGPPAGVDATCLLQGVSSSNPPSSDQGWEERQEEDNLLIERILLLVRNILHVPANLDQEKVRGSWVV